MQRLFFFHFHKLFIKQVQALGLQQLYANDPDVRDILGSAMALAFLPTEQMAASFEPIRDEQRAKFPQLDDLFEYF